jgi:hypothetical protein
MARSRVRIHPFAARFTPEIGPAAVKKLLAGQGVSPRQECFFWLFRQWLEIDGTLSSLMLSRKFLGAMRPHRVTADAIAYHVEKHLEETYILQQRMERFLKVLERKLKRRSLTTEAQEVARRREAFDKTLTRILGTRHAHVHEARFLDRGIGQLGVLDGILGLPGAHAFTGERRRLAREVLAKWRRLLGSRHRDLRRIVDDLLKHLTPIVFEKLPLQAFLRD